MSKSKAINKSTKKVVENDDLINFLKKPNHFQTEKQFKWDWMFWNMLGNSNIYIESDMFNRAAGNNMFLLNNAKIEYPHKMTMDADKLITDRSEIKKYKDYTIIYRYADGNILKIPNYKIVKSQDLTNSIGAWYKGNSAIDALYKIISNSELALDGQNVNLLLTKKFMVSGKSDISDTKSQMMGAPEKKTIEEEVLSEKNIHAVRNAIDIKRFVERLDKLQLPEAFKDCYLQICSMYGIPKELADANWEGSTYENQEKAMGRHISYTMQPKADDMMSGLERYFKVESSEIERVQSWDHLPFMQVFEADRATTNKSKAETFKILTESGASPEDAAMWCGIENVNFIDNGEGRTNNEA